MANLTDTLTGYRNAAAYVDIVADDNDWESCQLLEIGEDFILFTCEEGKFILPLSRLVYISEVTE